MQYITKIPPAITEDERENDFINGHEPRLTVLHLPTGQVVAQHVRPREAVEATWLHCGKDYALRPRMTPLTGENECTQTIPRQAIGRFGPEWDVYLKESAEMAWYRSGVTAYGVTERDAVVRLFEEAFCRGPFLPGYKITATS